VSDAAHVNETAYVSAFDDMLQMIASLSALDAKDERAAKKLASGLNTERQAHALSNIARILVHRLQVETEVTKTEVYAALRNSVVHRITEDANKNLRNPE
jgi:uncharacterized protein YutE (UPF0331/DUF86 family)